MAAMLTISDRAHFRRLGLTIQQIDEIEIILPSAKAWLAPISPMNAVKEKLQDIIASADATIKLLEGLKGGNLPHQKEAFGRVLIADSDVNNGIQTVELAIHSIENLREVTARALGELPRMQRQTSAISPQVLRLIDDALLRGVVLNGGVGPLLVPSSTPGNAYSEIARICLLAMGKDDPNPQAMIKSHLRWLTARRQHTLQKMESRGDKF